MTAPPTQTSLLSLPDELLETIVQCVLTERPKRPAALALTCRRLGRLVRHQIFRRIHYEGSARRGRDSLLQQAFEVCPSARNLVRDLLYLPQYNFSTGASVLVSDPELPYIFFIFPAIRTLDLAFTRSDGLTSFLTGPTTPNDGSLRHLEISYEFEREEENACMRRAGWWNPLLRFSDLLGLAVVVEPGGEDSGVVAFETARLLPLESVRKFTISALMFPTNGLPLSALLPSLEDLTVIMARCDDEADPCTRLIRTAPSSLAKLTIVTYSIASPWTAGFVEALTDRPTLRHLSLTCVAIDTYRASQYFSSSSLRALTFTSACPSDDVDLLRLVSGRTRMKSLEVLRFDYFRPSGRQGIRYSLADMLASTGPVDLASALESLRSHEGPRWPQGCTAAGLQRVVEEAQLHGIRVCGMAVESLDWVALFDDEVERYLVLRAVEKGDRSLIDEYFGRDKADEAIERHSWRFASASAAAMTS
ncbi:hypothetical protein BMF94_0459 [Rhodotorula taiwanensis]|uniref:F-box domain-containing protein n=1 Tax=Rhodotorula taiwanensis TaxID=741276 RepID=A0A2S5BHN3_9BASI|nr:hypothetical protein BMF94_0459 [Rhodotorula taiwanensis]